MSSSFSTVMNSQLIKSSKIHVKAELRRSTVLKYYRWSSVYVYRHHCICIFFTNSHSFKLYVVLCCFM